MPVDIYGVGGEVESPLFINFQRGRLDLSGSLENDRLRFEMAKDLADRGLKLKEKMRDLKMPEGMEGNTNDLDNAYTLFQQGKTLMESSFRKYGNVNAATNSEEFIQGSRMVTTATDPAVNEQRKNKQRSTKGFEENMGARLKQGVDVSSNMMVDQQGLLVVDPQASGSLLTAREAVKRDQYDADWTMDKPLGQSQLNAASLTTSDDLLKNLEDKLKTSAKTVEGSEWDDASKVDALLGSDPLLKLVMLTKQGRTTSSNVGNINAAVRNVFATLSNSDISGAYQGYAKTDDFQKRMSREYVKDDPHSGFLRDGVIDPVLIRNEMVGGSGFGKKDKAGKGDRSYFEEVVGNAAARFYDTSVLDKLDRTMIKNAYAAGGSSSELNKTTQWQYDALNGPMMKAEIDPLTNRVKTTPGLSVTTMHYPVVKEMPGGEVVEVPFPFQAINQKMTYDMHRGLEKQFGLREDNGKISETGGLTLGDISPSWRALTNSGTVIDKTKTSNAQIVKVYDSKQFRPPLDPDQLLDTSAVFENQALGVRMGVNGPEPDFNNPNRPVVNPVSGSAFTEQFVKVRVKFSGDDNAPVEDRFLDWADTPEGNKARMEYERERAAVLRRTGGGTQNSLMSGRAGAVDASTEPMTEKTQAALDALDEKFAGKIQQHGVFSKEPLFGPHSSKLNPTADDSWSVIGQEPGEMDIWLQVPPEQVREGPFMDPRMFNTGVRTGDEPRLPQQNQDALIDIIGSVVQPTDTTTIR